MTSSCRVGELCPLTVYAVADASSSATVKTGVSNNVVMSRQGCPGCRFMRSVDLTPTCWLWTGSKYTQFGKPTYGQFMFAGVRMSAHRASYILFVGPIPDGMDILHSCDVKACVNPRHLRPGTHQENIREAFAKFPPGHFAGENAGHARLTWAQVHAIRAAAASGARYVDLASRYGVSATHISLIVRGLRWIDPQASEAVA